jgi:HEAT repeat protein
MPRTSYLFDLDQLGASWLLLLSFLEVGIAAWFLVWIGVVGWVLKLVGMAVRATVRAGFWLWRLLLSRLDWPVFLGLVLAVLWLGIVGRSAFPALAVGCGTALLFLGVTTCLAYVFIDLERYDVARGYKAIHNPLPGQELAANLVRYGHRVGLPLLAAAACGVVGGFALLNQGLYETVGRSWYRLGEGGVQPDYPDFLAYTLIHLFGVVDLLHIANSYNYVHATYVQQARWPASTLLMLFKTFFTAVLLQQIFASVRRGKLLSETIADFWSPHPPIHERARGSLPQYGPGAVGPLLRSLAAIEVLTAEQRAYLPRIIADIGPSTVRVLLRHLHDPYENVRAVAVAALGHLHALDAVPELVELLTDPSVWVRQALAEALGTIAGPTGRAGRRRRSVRRALRASGTWVWRVLRRRRPPPAPVVDSLALAVSSLRAALSDPAVAVRTQAAQSLGLLGQLAAPAAPDLIGLLQDPEEPVRCRAAEALGRVRGPVAETVAALVGLLPSSDPALRVAAVGALGTMKKEAAEAVPSLTPLLQDGDEAVRQAAAEAIGSIGTLQEEAVAELTQGLASRDSLVRAQTAEVLSTIGPAAADAAPALADALTDDSDRVRAKAAQALGNMGEAAAEAVPSLVRALRDRDTWVSALAAEALGEIGESAGDAIPALTRSLHHSNPQVRTNAAASLGKLGAVAQGAAPALAQAARDPEDEVRVQALLALGAVGGQDPSATQTLLSALADANPRVRAAAVAAVGQKEDLKDVATRALLRAAEDANDEVKIQVARALPRAVGATPPVLEALGRLLQDHSSSVQAEAAQALGRLGPEAISAGEELLRLTQTGEAAVREQALRAIALIQPPQATAAFLAGLKDPQSEVRKLASAGLIKAAEVPPEVVPVLVENLHDPEAQVRANAARVLSRVEALPSEAASRLAECVVDPDDGVRLNAALALHGVPPGQVAPAWRHLLTDSNSRVQLLAASSLLKADPADAEATTALGRALADSSPRIRRSALELIESLGPGQPAMLELLRRRADDEVEPELSDRVGRLLEQLASRDAETSEPAGQGPPPVLTSS